MDSLLQRNYYKIFANTNQTSTANKLHLGYEGYSSEITFKKDQHTYFHVPFFAEPQLLINSTLVGSGAIPGPIPAMADRIFKKQGGYGKNTPWGNSSQIQDGTWLCSWLYSLSGEEPIWLDRYFDPGRLPIQEALEQNVNILNYIKHDPVYYDILSEMVLDPGVLYIYFHQGEKTNSEITTTYSGTSGDRLRLYIENWSEQTTDLSIFNNKIRIEDFQPSWVQAIESPGFLDRNALTFENNSFINSYVEYSNSYNLLNEFTLSFWVKNNNWDNATSTQIVGNLQQDGYGVFYNNLKNNPYYIIPETTYGHLFYLNQDNELYFQKNLQRTADIFVSPKFVTINSESETVLVDQRSNKVYKYNHLGDIIAQTKTVEGNFFTLDGEIKNATIDGDDNVFVITTTGTYTFNNELIFTTYLSSAPHINNECLTFNLNGELVREPNCFDVKFDYFGNKWSIGLDRKLYCNDEIHPFSGLSATNIAIDPNNILWVFGDVNDVYQYNTQTKQMVRRFKAGLTRRTPDKKNITFINEYNRENNTQEWSAIIIFNQEQSMYELALDGNIKKIIFLPSRLNVTDPLTSEQDLKKLTFDFLGDISGYETRRIFNKVKFDNKPQLQFKLTGKRPIPGFNAARFSLSVPVDYFIGNRWYLITCTLKNNEARLYINDKLKEQFNFSSIFSISYNYKNNLYIGTPTGKTKNLNTELNTSSLIWNGIIDRIRIYDYAINITQLQAFLREKTIGDDIVWDIPTSPLQYVDTVEQFFKHRLPGNKSTFYNLKISGLKIQDPNIRLQIEKNFKAILEQIAPAYSQLYKIIWVD